MTSPSDDQVVPASTPTPAGGVLVPTLMLFGLFVLAAVVPLALVLGGFLVLGQPIVAVVGLVVGLFGLRVLTLVRSSPVVLTGAVPVTEQQQAALWKLVDDTAAALDTPPPDELALVHDVDVVLGEDLSWLGLGVGRRVLAIGVGLLNTVRTDELHALVAHELAHHTSGSGAGRRVYRAQTAARRIVSGNREALLTAPVFSYLEALIARSAGAVRSQQLAADAAAAELYGEESTGGALRMVAIAGPAFEIYLREYAAPVWGEAAYPVDLYPGFRAFLTAPGRRGLIGDLRQAAMQARTADAEGHPPLHERISTLAGTGSGSVEAGQGSARDLLTDSFGVEDATSRILAIQVGASPTPEPVNLTEGDSSVWMQIQLRRAVLVARAAAHCRPGDTDGGLPRAVRALADSSAQMAHLLGPELASVPADQREVAELDVLQEYVRAAIGTALVDHVDCRWRVDWSGPVRLLGPDGAEVPLDDWVEDLLVDPSTAGSVLAWLTQAGVPVPTAA